MLVCTYRRRFRSHRVVNLRVFHCGCAHIVVVVFWMIACLLGCCGCSHQPDRDRWVVMVLLVLLASHWGKGDTFKMDRSSRPRGREAFAT